MVNANDEAFVEETEHATRAAKTGQMEDDTWFAVITYGAGAIEGFGDTETEARAHAGRKLKHVFEGGAEDAEVA